VIERDSRARYQPAKAGAVAKNSIEDGLAGGFGIRPGASGAHPKILTHFR